MKKTIFSLIIFLTFCSSIFALDNNYLSFKITPRFEIVNGSINEYVFNENNKNTNNKESQLDWDVRAIPIFRLKADFDLFRYIYIGFDGSIGIPKQSGNMQDYDWLNSIGTDIGYPEWESEDETELTNYSIHDNFLEKYITFSARLGLNIYIPAEIKLTPLIMYQYEFISFIGKEGYSIYKWNNRQAENFSGKVISYKQELNAMLLGLAFDISSLSHVYIYSDFLLSPKTTFINCMDYHHLPRRYHPNGIAFWDNITNIFQIQSNIVAQYKFNKYHQAGINAHIQYIPVSKGDTRTKSLTSEGIPATGYWTAPSKDTGGTSRLIWSLGINYSFSL